MGLPFVCLCIDISSWYMVKLYHPFAWVTMSAGALMGLCFASMWFTSIYQMWIGRTPNAVTERGSGDIRVIG